MGWGGGGWSPLLSKEPSAAPFSASQVSPLGLKAEFSQAEAGEPDHWEGKSPRFWGRGRGCEAHWASALRPQVAGVRWVCPAQVKWIMTVFLVLSLFHACSLNCILAQRRLKTHPIKMHYEIHLFIHDVVCVFIHQ